LKAKQLFSEPIVESVKFNAFGQLNFNSLHGGKNKSHSPEILQQNSSFFRGGKIKTHIFSTVKRIRVKVRTISLICYLNFGVFKIEPV
jgi:hypothetical protein